MISVSEEEIVSLWLDDSMGQKMGRGNLFYCFIL